MVFFGPATTFRTRLNIIYLLGNWFICRNQHWRNIVRLLQLWIDAMRQKRFRIMWWDIIIKIGIWGLWCWRGFLGIGWPWIQSRSEITLPGKWALIYFFRSLRLVCFCSWRRWSPSSERSQSWIWRGSCDDDWVWVQTDPFGVQSSGFLFYLFLYSAHLPLVWRWTPLCNFSWEKWSSSTQGKRWHPPSISNTSIPDVFVSSVPSSASAHRLSCWHPRRSSPILP